MSFSNTWQWKVKVKSLSPVRLFLTPWTTYSPPGSSIHEIFQARGLEWGATAFSNRTEVWKKSTTYSNWENKLSNNMNNIVLEFYFFIILFFCKKNSRDLESQTNWQTEIDNRFLKSTTHTKNKNWWIWISWLVKLIVLNQCQFCFDNSL